MVDKHIHTPDDGRGPRAIYVDGQKIDKAFYADTRRGVVDYYPQPYRTDRWRKRILSRRLRGRVEVRQIND